MLDQLFKNVESFLRSLSAEFTKNNLLSKYWRKVRYYCCRQKLTVKKAFRILYCILELFSDSLGFFRNFADSTGCFQFFQTPLDFLRSFLYSFGFSRSLGFFRIPRTYWKFGRIVWYSFGLFSYSSGFCRILLDSVWTFSDGISCFMILSNSTEFS